MMNYQSVLEPLGCNFAIPILLVGAVAVRIVQSTTRSFVFVHEKQVERLGFFDYFGYFFCGYRNRNSTVFIEYKKKYQYSYMKKLPPTDYWITVVIGIFEILLYFSALQISMLEIAAAWLTLKTVAQWREWNEDRLVFNVFLLGNILIIAIAFILFARVD